MDCGQLVDVLEVGRFLWCNAGSCEGFHFVPVQNDFEIIFVAFEADMFHRDIQFSPIVHPIGLDTCEI